MKNQIPIIDEFEKELNSFWEQVKNNEIKITVEEAAVASMLLNLYPKNKFNYEDIDRDIKN